MSLQDCKIVGDHVTYAEYSKQPDGVETRRSRIDYVPI